MGLSGCFTYAYCIPATMLADDESVSSDRCNNLLVCLYTKAFTPGGVGTGDASTTARNKIVKNNLHDKIGVCLFGYVHDIYIHVHV